MTSDCFFCQQFCDRCGSPLSGGRTMSRFNEDCICMACAEKERQHPDYKRACEAERNAFMHGDRNFPGIGKPADL